MKCLSLVLALTVLSVTQATQARERKLITDYTSYFHVCPTTVGTCVPSIKVNGKSYFFDSAEPQVGTQVNETLAAYSTHQLRKTVMFTVSGFVRLVPNFMGYGPREVFQITEIKGLMIPN